MKTAAKIAGFWLILIGCAGVFAQPYNENPKQPLLYPKAQQFPKIDGEMDDIWLNAPRYVISNYAIGAKALEGNPWYDCSAEWRAMWNDQALFFYAEARDDSLKSRVPPDFTTELNGYQYDSFEFYNDADHSRQTNYDGVDDVQFRLHYGDVAKMIWVWTNLKGPAFDISEFKWASKKTATGWAVEFMAIMDEIFLFPEPGMLIGTDVHYNDNDYGKSRDHKVVAFGNVEQSHANPTYFATAVLSGWTASDTLMVTRAAHAPAIDAALDDEWSGVPAIPGSRYMSLDKLRNYGDCSMNTRMMWDSDNLYYFVKVWDDTLMRDSGGDYRDDSVELYVDGDYSHGSAYDKANDFQFALAYQSGAQPLDAIHLTGSSVGTPIDLSGIRQFSATFLDTVHAVRNKKAVIDTIGRGMILELSIPLASLHLTPAAGRVFGVEMDYNDDDDGGDRDTKLKTYGRTDDTWQNPGLMRPAKLVAATAGELSDVGQKELVPTGFSLMQNFPNPFNPSTEIVYEVPAPQKVRLTVFDIMGREICVLADGFQAAGRHRVSFQAGSLASGVYLYRIETPDRSVVKKMLLMR